MKKIINELSERVAAPTPRWFQRLSRIGFILAAVGGALVAAPVTLPAVVVSVGGYLLLGGSVITAVSQTAVKREEDPPVPSATSRSR